MLYVSPEHYECLSPDQREGVRVHPYLSGCEAHTEEQVRAYFILGIRLLDAMHTHEGDAHAWDFESERTR